MKRIRHIGILLAFLGFLQPLFPKPVTEAEVRSVVYALLEEHGRQAEILHMGASYLPDGTLGYYLVDLGEGGWILISGDDVVRPVLAFSFEDHLSDEKDWNDAARYLLGLYRQEITRAVRNPELPRDARWDREEVASATKSVAADPIAPFIGVTWDQGSGWNMFCPYDVDGPGDHAYVGCVAVSMAQAMSVYEYPARPKGIKSYVHDVYGSIAVNYNLADPYQWNQMSPSSPDEFNAILLYHCAVAVEMDFGPDASGAYVRNAGAAMHNYFGYSGSATFRNRLADAEAWKALLLDELVASRPIIYRGVNDEGGHAWNIDGYYDMNGQAFFHMNFGWSGRQNGYYTIDNINPGSSAYDVDQGALLGISPPVSRPYDLTLSELAVSEGLPEGSWVADLTVSDDDPDNVYTFTCHGPYNFLLRQYAPASFYVENDMLFTDKVFAYNDSDPDANLEYLLIIVEDQYGNEYQEEFEIAIEEIYGGPTGIALSDSSVKENQPVGTAVAAVLVEDKDLGNSYTYALYGPYNTQSSAYDPASFYVENDTLKTSVVFDLEIADTCHVLVELTDSYGNQLSRAFTIRIEADQSSSTGVMPVTVEQDRLYPNPADQWVMFREMDPGSSLKIYEASTGRMVARLPHLEEGEINVSGLQEGLYLVVMEASGEIIVQKLLIQH